FSKDAATEMKDRLRQSLEDNRKTDPEYMDHQLAFLETADICTIDSFCLSVVQNYYYLNPDWTLKMTRQAASDAQRAQLLDEAYQQAKKEMDEEALGLLLSYFTALGKKEEDIQTSIQSLLTISDAKPDPMEWIKSLSQQQNPQVESWFEKTLSVKLLLLKAHYEEIKDWHPAFETRLTLLEHCIQRYQKEGYDGLIDGYLHYFTNAGTFPGVKKVLVPVTEALHKQKSDAVKDLEKGIASLLYPKELWDKDQKDMQPVKQAFCTLCMKTKEAYQTFKRKAEVLDFADMSQFAYDLISQQDIVRNELKQKYAFILIDEFQDTNDLQERIIKLISRGNNVFRVGDIKQAIYGFRQARPAIMKGHLEGNDDTNIIMDKNFRSNQSIIDFNNDFYQKLMNTPGLDPQFSEIDIARVGSANQSLAKQYPIRFLYTEYGKEEGNGTTLKSLAKKNRYDIIARDIMARHEEGVAYKDICILARQRDVFEDLRDALEAYGIPVLAEINHGFYKNAAVQIVLSTLTALTDPHNDIALCASLLSPIGNVKAADLAQAGRPNKTSLYEKIKDQPVLDDWKPLLQKRHEPLTALLQAIYAHNDFYQNHTSMI
ncbi:MAG: UvrD-helicase domain-containing protein, partial [Erysipelotrichaceae bacterium]|nr:UvrD-helicase domain-containing protein [Erysipelotrichaceae bacterium]